MPPHPTAGPPRPGDGRAAGPESLSSLGIHLRHDRPGEQRCACPDCARRKLRKGDDALAVKIEPEGSSTWICHRCGWTGALPASGAWGRPAVRQTAPLRRAEPKARPEAAQHSSLAQDIWRQTEDIWPGAREPWRYLRERRGIGRWDHDRLRWHPACPWRDTPRAPLLHVGCIVAPVNAQAGGLVVGVWRIRPLLEGRVPRRGLGPTKGNAARLFPAAGPLLAVAEGVEDAVSYRELSGVPTWAALSAGNLIELVLPARFTEVHVVADVDDVGMQRAREAVLRFRREGREARLIRPVEAKDANDVLRARRMAG